MTIFAPTNEQKMTFQNIYLEDLGIEMEEAAFVPASGVAEWHIMLHVAPQDDLFATQLARVYAAEERILAMTEHTGAHYIMKRYFLSDSANQQPLMRTETEVAVSIIQQQPLDGSKIAVWLYLQRGTEAANENGLICVRHNGYKHLWKMGMHQHKGDSAWQTESLLIEYEEMLHAMGATLADHCIRTWFFVRDVDTQYAGLVKARRENFLQQGLNPHTHYIASTGIGGIPANTRALVQMGAYALLGFQPDQLQYLHATTHLNPTIEYGVTFERGTVLQFGDRRHVYISGTASIDNQGNVVHVGDILGQAHRMWENVEALLQEGGAGFQDVMQIIVYLRDTADYETVKRLFSERFPHIPTVFTLAPVCRPTWLIEMECVAVLPSHCPQYHDF